MKKNKRYFPLSFFFMTLISMLSAAIILILLFFLREKMPYFRTAVFIVKSAFAIKILNSSFPAQSKCSWLFMILTLPFVSIPIYLVFYRPTTSREEILILDEISHKRPKRDPFYSSLSLLECEGFYFARELSYASSASVYTGSEAKYIRSAKEKREMLLYDLKRAKSFIFLEFYTIATGSFWGEIFDVLCEKASHGVEVRVIWDELGSLGRIPNDFKKRLRAHGIIATSYRERRGLFIAGMNNRNHRKIAVIDGTVAYTGGINIADEYINPTKRLRSWKDSAIRLSGDSVNELTFLFLSDFSLINGKNESFFPYYRYRKRKSEGFIIPFGDGPRPLYEKKCSRAAIMSMLFYAKEYVTITTPYLICDGDMLSAIEGAVRRGVNVKIIIPSHPDRYIAYLLTKSCAERLMRIGAEVYEYSPGFLHAKTYVADGKYAIVGSVNLDYRSIWHNFENGVWFYSHPIISEIKSDTDAVLSDSRPLKSKRRAFLPERLSRAVAEIFAPLF